MAHSEEPIVSHVWRCVVHTGKEPMHVTSSISGWFHVPLDLLSRGFTIQRHRLSLLSRAPLLAGLPSAEQ